MAMDVPLVICYHGRNSCLLLPESRSAVVVEKYSMPRGPIIVQCCVLM